MTMTEDRGSRTKNTSYYFCFVTIVCVSDRVIRTRTKHVYQCIVDDYTEWTSIKCTFIFYYILYNYSYYPSVEPILIRYSGTVVHSFSAYFFLCSEILLKWNNNFFSFFNNQQSCGVFDWFDMIFFKHFNTCDQGWAS